MSLRNSLTFLGRATGPVLFTAVAATTGYRPLLLAGGAVALGCATLVAVTSAGSDPAVGDPEGTP